MTLLFALGTALFFYFGFLRPPELHPHRLRTGFAVMLLLTSVSGYFAWREWRSLQELTALIDPIPEISDVVYVATLGEIQAIANMAAAVPGGSRFGATQAERQSFAARLPDDPPRYWIPSSTTLTPDEVATFYRDASHRRGWTIETDAPPWIILSRGPEQLMLFARKDWTETDVLYIYKK